MDNSKNGIKMGRGANDFGMGGFKGSNRSGVNLLFALFQHDQQLVTVKSHSAIADENKVLQKHKRN
jgi:hypothetical protein